MYNFFYYIKKALKYSINFLFSFNNLLKFITKYLTDVKISIKKHEGERMKKYLLLLLSTGIIIASILIYTFSVDSNTVKIGVLELKSQPVQNEVICSGKVEEVDFENVYLDMPVVVDKINFDVGDYIEKGEAIMQVDTAATYATISAGVGTQGLGDANISQEVINMYTGSSGLSMDSYDYSSIPERIYASINASMGEIAWTSSSIATISDLSSLQVKISVDENDISDINIGQSVKITGSGFKDKEYHGTVQKIYPSARQQQLGTNTETVVDAIVSIDDADEYIKPGFNIDAAIVTDVQSTALVVPYECIRQDDNGQEYVYVYNAKSARRVNIQSSEEIAAGAVISSGLKDGDRVITNPDDIASTGMRVEVEQGDDTDA